MTKIMIQYTDAQRIFSPARMQKYLRFMGVQEREVLPITYRPEGLLKKVTAL